MPDKKTLKLTFGNGDDAAAVFMAVEDDPHDQTAGSGALEHVSSDMDDGELEARFSKITRSLAGIAESMHEKIAGIAGDARPDKVTMELSGTLKGKANFWIVEGETSGALKFTLTWERKDP